MYSSLYRSKLSSIKAKQVSRNNQILLQQKCKNTHDQSHKSSAVWCLLIRCSTNRSMCHLCSPKERKVSQDCEGSMIAPFLLFFFESAMGRKSCNIIGKRSISYSLPSFILRLVYTQVWMRSENRVIFPPILECVNSYGKFSIEYDRSSFSFHC